MISDIRHGINVDANYRSRSSKASNRRKNSRQSSSGTINSISINESDVRPATMSEGSGGIREDAVPSNIATEKRRLGMNHNIPQSWDNMDDEVPSLVDSYLPSDVEEAKRTFMGYTKFQTDDEEGNWVPPLDSDDVLTNSELLNFEKEQQAESTNRRHRSQERRALTDRIQMKKSQSRGIAEEDEEASEENRSKSEKKKRRKKSKKKKRDKKVKKDKVKKSKKERRKKKGRRKKLNSKDSKSKSPVSGYGVSQDKSHDKTNEISKIADIPLDRIDRNLQDLENEKTQKNFFSARSHRPLQLEIEPEQIKTDRHGLEKPSDLAPHKGFDPLRR
jgi:flagellar biosynthesis GTPase FlhF